VEIKVNEVIRANEAIKDTEGLTAMKVQGASKVYKEIGGRQVNMARKANKGTKGQQVILEI
jgi:hypothetical protein